MIRPQMSYQRLLIIPALALVTFAIAGCSGGNSSSPTATVAVSTPAPSPTTAFAAAALIKLGTTAKGTVLMDSTGFSLYMFDNDKTPGASSCNGGCSSTWPPIMTTAAAAPSGITGATGAFSLITRDDGTKQVAYKGKPLYRYTPDKAAGDTTGDGVGGVWHLATP